MNPRLVVGEHPRQMKRRRAPVEPQVIGSKTHNHGAHAKGQPPGRGERAHAGIDQRIACLPLLPRRQEGVCPVMILLEMAIGGMERAEFCGRFILDLLDEMAVPVKPALKTANGLRPAAPVGRRASRERCLAAGGFLPDLAHRQHAKSQIGRQARTAGRRRHRR